MSQAHPQLPLDMQIRADFTFENFIEGGNGALLSHLNRQLDESGQMLYLWGKPGVGCSHLLQASCHLASQHRRVSIYLPLDQALDYGPEILENLESIELVCLDHLQAIAGQRDWEEALFHLYNRVKAENNALLMAASGAVKHLSLQLADLESRLSACALYQVQPLDDDGKLELLRLQAGNRGLQLSDDAGRYILSRSDRSATQLVGLMGQLDRQALAASRGGLTVPFIKNIMNW